MNWTFWTRTQPTDPDDCATLDPLLSPYADGAVSAEEALRIEAHLPGCAACRESLAWLRATRSALAARPVALPPADLRARIAEAIAAADAPAPATFRTRRAFALRPALAAAASAVMLGLVSYNLLHHPPSAVHPVTPPQMASAPPAAATPVPRVKMRLTPHPAALPKHTRLNPDQVARSQPTEDVPAPAVVKRHPQPSAKTDTRMLADDAPAPVPVRPQPLVVKKPILRTPRPQMMATTKSPAFSAVPRRLPGIKPEPKATDTVVAEAPRAAAPSIIEKQPIITHDPAPTVAVASGQEGHIQTAEAHGVIKFHYAALKAFTHATVGAIDKSAILAKGLGPDRSGTESFVSAPLP